ncbi:MAG: DMT family transporter [Candidatus Dormibacteraceae bacterium]
MIAAPPASRAYVPLAVLFSLLWASAFLAVKVALAYSPPLFLMGSRFIVAALLLLGLAVLGGQVFPAGPRGWARLTVLGLLNYALYLGISAVALRHLSAGMGAVLASTIPLLLAIAGFGLLGERLTRRRVVGLLIAFVSVTAMMWSRTSLRDQPGAMGLILLANVFYATGTILFKRWHPTESTTVLNGVQFLAAGAALLVPSLLLEPIAGVRPALPFLAAMAYLTLVVSLGAMSIWFYMLRAGDATRASSFFFLNPIFGLLLAALLLAEPVHGLDIPGTIGVAAGIWLVQRE